MPIYQQIAAISIFHSYNDSTTRASNSSTRCVTARTDTQVSVCFGPPCSQQSLTISFEYSNTRYSTRTVKQLDSYSAAEDGDLPQIKQTSAAEWKQYIFMQMDSTHTPHVHRIVPRSPNAIENNNSPITQLCHSAAYTTTVHFAMFLLPKVTQKYVYHETVI